MQAQVQVGLGGALTPAFLGLPDDAEAADLGPHCEGKPQITGKAAPNVRAGPDLGISSKGGMRTKQNQASGSHRPRLSCRK